MGNSKDCATAEPNIKPYVNDQSVRCFIISEQNEWYISFDNISLFVYTMAWQVSLGLHATMDSEAADGSLNILQHYSIL